LLVSCGGHSKPASPSNRPAQATIALIDRAQAYERNRRYDLARPRYQQAVDKAPEATSKAHAARTFASALLFWGEVAAAEQMLLVTVEADPDKTGAWHDLGILRAKRGADEEAEQALLTSIRLAPDDPRSRIALAAVLVKQHRYRQALTEYETLRNFELPERMRSAIERAIGLLRPEIDKAGSP